MFNRLPSPNDRVVDRRPPQAGPVSRSRPARPRLAFFLDVRADDWQARVNVVVPAVLLLIVVGATSLATDLVASVLVEGPVPLDRSLGLHKMKAAVIVLASVLSVMFGVWHAFTISGLLRRMMRTLGTYIGHSNVGGRRAAVSRWRDVASAWKFMLGELSALARKAHIIDTMPVGVVVIDAQGTVKSCNNEAQRLLRPHGLRARGSEDRGFCLDPQLASALAPVIKRVRDSGGGLPLSPLPWLDAGPARDLSGLVLPWSGQQPVRDIVVLVTESVLLGEGRSAAAAPRPENGRRPHPEAGGAAATAASPAKDATKAAARAAGTPGVRDGAAHPAAPATVPREAPKPAEGSSSATAQHAPALVDDIVQEAIRTRASDIHFGPTISGMAVRFRVDGLLRNVRTIAPDSRAAVISRIKILCNMDIAEHRLPQDGRMRVAYGNRSVDARVSTTPSLYGEKIVIRLLDLEAVAIPLQQCGIDENDLRVLRRVVRRPQGVIFVTGPTGSGKTSTIYACLNDIKNETTNIVTIEDPVEYEIAGLTQIAVHEKIGLTFANVLRAVLRQDPDVVLVGEVRDVETARTAMQASLTGHMVFSTLHTNDAVGSITRLNDMGIPPYLIGSSLSLVMAQRLARVLCDACRVPWDPDAHTRRLLGIDEAAVTLYRSGGCQRCHNSGVVGRTGLFELVEITPALRNLITARASEAEIRATARAAGMRSLYDHGVTKVRSGIIAYEELLRVTEPPSEVVSGPPAPRTQWSDQPTS